MYGVRPSRFRNTLDAKKTHRGQPGLAQSMQRFRPQLKSAVPTIAALLLAACGGGGGGGSAPPPLPTVSLTTSAKDVAKGASVTLSWTTTGATSCSSSADWNGALATAGSQTAVVNRTSQYDLNCQGPGGSASVSVVVEAWEAPRASLSANPPEIVADSSVSLEWGAVFATSCQLRDTPGQLPVFGTTPSARLTVDTTIFIVCSNPIFSTTTSVTVHVSPTYTLAVTVKYQAPGRAVLNSTFQLAPNWTSPLENAVPFVLVELQDRAGNVVRQAFADSRGVATLSNLDPAANYTPVIRSAAQDPSRAFDLMVLDNTDPVSTAQPTFRARYHSYSEAAIEYGRTNLVSQSITVTAPDGWDAAKNRLDDSQRIASPFALLANAVAEADLVTAASGASPSQWRPLSILWSVHNKGGLSSPPNNYDLGLVGGSGGFYSSGHGGIDASGVASGSSLAEDFIFLSGDASFEAMDIYPTAMTHEMGHFVQRLFSTLDSPGGSHARGDFEDQTLSWTEGSASAISALTMNTQLQDRTVASGGTILVSSYDIKTDLYNGSVLGHASRGWFSEDTVTRLLWTLYDPAGTIGLTPAEVLAPMFGSTWRGAAWPNTVWGYLSVLKYTTPGRAASFDNAADALYITATGNDAWGSTETHPATGSSTDVLPPHPIIHVGEPSVVCSVGRPNEYNKAGNVRYLRLALDGNTRTLTVRGPSGTVPILDRFYFQPGNSVATQTGTFPAGDQVVSIGDCAVAKSPNASDTAACNEPSPPMNICWSITLQ